MKLLRFLERRLTDPLPQNMLHKWIRSGQVRVNGGRAKSFDTLEAGDAVRIPPFAAVRSLEGDSSPGSLAGTAALAGNALGPDLHVAGGTEHYLILSKPGGLPCQPGSGHSDSVSTRLAEVFSSSSFIPAPAHRLDRDTSGLVIAGLSHAAQQWLHTLFRHGGIHKEYLAWVAGDWPHESPCLLEDTLAVQQDRDGRERVGPIGQGNIGPVAGNKGVLLEKDAMRSQGKSLCVALAVERLPLEAMRSLPAFLRGEKTNARIGYGSATLLLLRLLTGHKHQIRVQLASRGFAIIGDRRYGGPPFSRMLLHAYALGLPAAPMPYSSSPPTPQTFTLPPDWPAPFSPDPIALVKVADTLRSALPESRSMSLDAT